MITPRLLAQSYKQLVRRLLRTSSSYDRSEIKSCQIFYYFILFVKHFFLLLMLPSRCCLQVLVYLFGLNTRRRPGASVKLMEILGAKDFEKIDQFWRLRPFINPFHPNCRILVQILDLFLLLKPEGDCQIKLAYCST